MTRLIRPEAARPDESQFGDAGADGGGAKGPPWLVAALAAVVALVVAWVYHPVLDSQAIWLDDQQYVTENPLVLDPSWRSVAAFLSEVGHPSTVVGYYQPLTMVSLMLDTAAGGRADHLRPYHRTNLILHVLNAVWIVLLLTMLFGEPRTAAMLGLLFGVHPLTVEPVAWMTERKTLLATFFALGSLTAYVRYAQLARRAEHAPARPAARAWYVSALLGYALSLLSKPTTIPIPLLCLLLDYWPLRRMGRTALLDKLPFVAIAAVSVIVTVVSQDNVGVVEYPGDQSALGIVLAIFHNAVFYLGKMVWPGDLAGYYLRPGDVSLSSPLLLASIAGTMAVTALAVWARRWTPAFLIGWVFLLVALLPTMGVIRVATTIASEKYAYFPSLGLLLALGWLGARAWRLGERASGRPSVSRALICAVALLVAAAEVRATRAYAAAWRDNEALYGYVRARVPGAWWLEIALADWLAKHGDAEGAARHYLLAETGRERAGAPPRAAVQLNLGNALMVLGRTEEGVLRYQRALELEPDNAAALTNLGVALRARGEAERAVGILRRVLDADPGNAVAHYELAQCLAAQGRSREASASYRAAIQADPSLLAPRIDLADALLEAGDLDAAIREYRAALALDADDTHIRNNLGAALLSDGRVAEAIEEFRAVLRRVPDDPDAAGNLREALRQQ